RLLANEWAARGINVNAIAPGYFVTGNTEALRKDEARNRAILDRIPAARWGNPSDLGGAAVFLASRAADDVHGALLPADGGAPATTGGAAADAQHVFVVSDRQQLVAALAFPDATPKIIYVSGTIEANTNDSGQPLQCSDYITSDPQGSEVYSLSAYLAAYDPATWGTTTLPSGPQERARAASQLLQQARVRIRIGANTTIVGLGANAQIHGGWFDIRPPTGPVTAEMN